MEEGSDPELLLLWWLFTRHNVMPWEVYERPQGYRDLAEAFALRELEQLQEARLQRKAQAKAAPPARRGRR